MAMRLHILFGVVLVASCVAPEAWRPLGPEDYEVYTALLRQFEVRDGKGGPTAFALLDSTRSQPPTVPGIKPTEPALWGKVLGQTDALEEAVADFQLQRRHECELERSASAGVEYILLRSSEIYRHADADSNLRGVFLFSRVGFSRDRQHAFLFLEHYVGTVSAIGRFYFLSLRDGRWQVAFNPGGMSVS